MENRPPPNPQLLHRTNTDLNISVLKRYVPSIHSILSIVANAVVYTFGADSQSWDKSGVEGTLFVCSQDPSHAGASVRACVFVLNRRGLDNVVIELSKVSEVEITEQLLILRLEETWPSHTGDPATDNEEESDPKIIGLWMHADQDDTRELNGMLIYEVWRRVRSAEQNAAAIHENNGGSGAFLAVEEDVGPAMQAMGKRLSLSELFGPSNGGGGAT
jgi:hypothetical protein